MFGQYNNNAYIWYICRWPSNKKNDLNSQPLMLCLVNGKVKCRH